MTDRTEAAARANDPVGWKWYDAADPEKFGGAMEVFRNHQLVSMTRALAAADAVPSKDAEVETLAADMEWGGKRFGNIQDFKRAATLLRSLAAREAVLREEVRQLRETARDFTALQRALVGSTGLSAITVANQWRKEHGIPEYEV